jgi:PilZ domain
LRIDADHLPFLESGNAVKCDERHLQVSGIETPLVLGARVEVHRLWKRAQCVITSIESSEQNPKVVLEVIGDQPDIWTLQPNAETPLNRKNRWRHKRFACLGDVEIRTEDADQIICMGALNDISFGGCFVCSSNNRTATPCADTVRVRINVGDELFVGNGRIVTSSEVGLGIEFANLDRAAAQQLSRIIRQLQ